jgi:hypothetical protein
MKREIDWRVKDGFVPTRFFVVGELVRYGNHDNCEILEVLENGAVYKVRCFGIKEVYGKPTEYSNHLEVNWYNLLKLDRDEYYPSFTKDKEFRMSQSNRDIEGLLSMVLGDHAGVDFTPEYQREYVWSNEDKVKLIESIFNNVTIGLFLFANLPYQDNAKQYEIIDGKQRLSALIDFFEDRFSYQGVYYSELSNKDMRQFDNYSISIGFLNEPTEKEKYAAFLAVNTFGKVMDKEHIESVREKYDLM